MADPKKPRPVFYPELADYFVKLRKEKGWTQLRAAKLAYEGEINLSYNVLRGLETGTIKAIETSTLRAVAKLYTVPFEEIWSQYCAKRYGIEIIGQIMIAPSPTADTRVDHEQDDSLRRAQEAIQQLRESVLAHASALLDAARENPGEQTADISEARSGVRQNAGRDDRRETQDPRLDHDSQHEPIDGDD